MSRTPRSPHSPPVILLLSITVVLALGAALLAWQPWAEADDRPGPTADPTPTVTPAPSSPTEEPPPAEPEPVEPEPAGPAVFTIGAVGDVLPHDTPIRVAHQGGDDYDFTPLLEATRAWSEGVDLAICNMEVSIVLPGEQPAGYPLFAAPEDLVSNLAGLGWDGCSTASNHTLDRGPLNAEYTLDKFDEFSLGHAGSARSAAEEDRPQFYELEREGQTIRVAQVGATFSTNGLPIPADKPWVISMLEVDSVLERAQRARDEGADLVFATLHWGNEYQLYASDFQRDFAAALADSGLIDLIIGNHPHVPQEFERFDGGPGGNGMWVAYSLGNFISNQDSNCCVPETATGLFLTVTAEKPADEPARVTGMEWTPMTVDRLGSNYAYPLLDLLSERPDRVTLTDDVLRDRLARVERIMSNSRGAEFSMRTQAPEPTGPPPRVIPRAD